MQSDILTAFDICWIVVGNPTSYDTEMIGDD